MSSWNVDNLTGATLGRRRACCVNVPTELNQACALQVHPQLEETVNTEMTKPGASDATMASSPTANVGGKRYVLIGKSRVTTIPKKKHGIGAKAKTSTSASK